MNIRFWITVVVVFVLTMIFGFLIHETLLKADYAQLGLMRSDADAMAHFPYLLLAHVFFALGVAWIYRQGVKPGVAWMTQGIRFGVALSFVTCIYMYLIYYAVQPMTPGLVASPECRLECSA